MNYQIIRNIGRGSFSSVFMIKDKNTDNIYVQKNIKEKYFDYTEHESKILKLLKKIRHKNIVEFIDEIIIEKKRIFLFERLFVNLYNYYKQYLLSLDIILSFSKQISYGLDFLHKLFIIHADIKPENIMITNLNEKKIKIIDFGSSIINDTKKKTHFYIVSRYYRAPEIIYKKQFNEKIDMWSLGCIIFELFTNEPLFYCKNNHNLKQIFTMFEFKTDVVSKLNFSKHFYENSILIQTSILDLLIFLLEFDYTKRFTAYQCLNHRLFKTLKL